MSIIVQILAARSSAVFVISVEREICADLILVPFGKSWINAVSLPALLTGVSVNNVVGNVFCRIRHLMIESPSGIVIEHRRNQSVVVGSIALNWKIKEWCLC